MIILGAWALAVHAAEGCAFDLSPVQASPSDAQPQPSETSVDAPLDVAARDSDVRDSAPDASTDAPRPTVSCDAASILSCFRFEGNVADEAPSPAATPIVSGVSFAFGYSGQAVIVGASSSILFPTQARWDVSQYTIEARVNPSGLPDAGDRSGIFDSDGRYGLFLVDGGYPLCTRATQSTRIIPTNAWTHLACVSDGLTLSLYIDGVLDSAAAVVPPTGAPGTTAIGSNAPSSEPFHGAIDDLRIFSIARTAAQIAEAAGR